MFFSGQACGLTPKDYVLTSLCPISRIGREFRTRNLRLEPLCAFSLIL